MVETIYHASIGDPSSLVVYIIARPPGMLCIESSVAVVAKSVLSAEKHERLEILVLDLTMYAATLTDAKLANTPHDEKNKFSAGFWQVPQ